MTRGRIFNSNRLFRGASLHCRLFGSEHRVVN